MAFQFSKIIILAIFVTVLGMYSSLAVATSRSIPGRGNMAERHEHWMKQYGRVYNDQVEKAKRFKIFNQNVKFIESFNLNQTNSYKLAVNEFADVSNEEFRASRGGYKRSPHNTFSTNFRHENVTAIPASLDWRKKGAVTAVKNQFTCGCCWAFSAVAATEGINGIKTGKLVSLSEQELVDCDIKNNEGCDGGLMNEAFEFIIHQGLSTEANYPYRGENGMCNRKKESWRVAKITGYENVPSEDESALLKAVAKQPVSVAIDASGPTFRFFAGGIYTGECGTDLDHGVTVVGYGKSKSGKKYWLVKNSWGAEWGEGGYVKFERDVGAKKGLCGIAMDASYPIKKASSTQQPHKHTHLLLIDRTDFWTNTRARWSEAVNEKANSLLKNNNLILVDMPKGKKTLGCKWIYKLKEMTPKLK
ncbi:senescence-specific cysteine protease SAG39-like [Henckelia pumila]|uniref:senescence-specific cysteine protease SAG39-like n=1 Tax=Henckelia pumila TaxID=405737 RepID=UPI003C6E98DB